MKLKTRIKISMVGIMAAMVAIYTAIILGSTIQTYRRDMEDSLRSVGEQKLMTMDSLMNTMVTITENPCLTIPSCPSCEKARRITVRRRRAISNIWTTKR